MSDTNKEAVLEHLNRAKMIYADNKDYTSRALVEVLGQIYWEIHLDMHLNHRQTDEEGVTNNNWNTNKGRNNNE